MAQLTPDTVFINGSAIATLYGHAAAVQTLVSDRTGEDISDAMVREVLAAWLLSCVEDWCSDVAEHLSRDPGHWDEFKQHWQQAQAMENRRRVAEDQADYFHMAA